MATNIAWNNGGTAEVLTANGVQVAVSSTRPFPPGCPAQGSLTHVAPSMHFTLKVANSRKTAEGIWEVRGRLTTGTRDVIDAFATLAAANHPQG